MLFSRQISRRLSERSARSMTMLIATEEFPLNNAISPIIRPAPLVSESTLSNGIKIITRNTGSPITTIKFCIQGGSRAESINEKGAAHMLSVTAFAGTAKRSGLKLVRDLENLGAHIDSTVDREQITYEVVVPTNHAEEAFSCVSEAVVLPPHAAYVIKEHKPNADLAYSNLKKNPHMQLKELLHEAAFGEDTPLGSSLYAINLNKLEVERILEYRYKTYISGNVTVTASGGVSHEQLKELVDCYLHTLHDAGAAVGTAQPSRLPGLPESPYIGGDAKIRSDLNGVTYLALAFPVPVGDAAKPYEMLKSVITTQFQNVENNTLSCFYYAYSTGGIFGFSSSGDATAATETLKSAINVLKVVAGGGSGIDAAKAAVSLQSHLAVNSQLKNADMKGVSTADVTAAAVSALSAIPAYAVLGKTAGTLPLSKIEGLIKMK